MSTMRRASAAVALVATMVLAGCAGPDSVAGGGAGTSPAGGAEGAADPTRAGTPDLAVTEVASGLEDVWDIGVLPDGRLLLTERDGRLTLLSGAEEGATATEVDADFGDLLAQGEGGLLGMVIHPDFAQTRRFTTCQTHTENGAPDDIRLITWELAADGSSASRLVDPLVGGLPILASGRHSGCRPTIAADGALLVGTGDTARAAVPQDLTSLGGKVLRVDLETGEPAAGNPFADAADPAQRLILTYGHRNVQGVAVQPGTGDVWTAEHGPSTDDEVNVLRPGGNYGWDPSQGGTVDDYDESVPMTDLDRFPDAVPAAWSSGSPVEALAGAAFLSGPQWGDLDGTLVVAALRGQKLLFMTPGADGAVSAVGVPDQFDGTYGRLRAVRLAPDGALLVSTSNGSDDRVLRIDPV
jgi:glucose/arabinose dehydrogenase